MPFDPASKADVFVTVESPSEMETEPRAVIVPRCATESEVMAARMSDPQRDYLSCLLGLLEPIAWMSGLHSDVDGGWFDARREEFISFETARQWISERIAELGLDEDLVNAFPSSHCSLAEDVAFRSAPFERQLDRFRRKVD